MSTKFTLGLLLGVAAGAAVVHFLNTEEGKALLCRIKKDAAEAGEDLNAMADDLIQKGKSIIDETETYVNKASS